MDELELFRGVVPFVAVVEEQSFRRAAIRLRVSPAAISKSVKTLEASLGVPLLSRTSRVVTLTREGETYFEQSRTAVAALRGAHDVLEATSKAPEGELVVSLPFVLTDLVASGLGLLHQRFRKLIFRVQVTDQLSKLAQEKIDVAVRIGPLANSSLVARMLTTTTIVTVAAPGYLARMGRPERPEDLEKHTCLALVSPSGKPYPWLFASGARAFSTTVRLDHGPMLRDVIAAGLGIGQLFDFMAEPLVRAGRLEVVLLHENAEGPAVHAVCAPGRIATPRVRAAFDAFADAFSRPKSMRK
jgi:LysR family transcriptional regulator, regulator for bpeEF and oprC